MKRKYEFYDSRVLKNGTRIYQLIASKSFGDVKIGDLGGWVESDKNLSQDGSCWIDQGCFVLDTAVVTDNSRIKGTTVIYGDSYVLGDSIIGGNTCIINGGRFLDEFIIDGIILFSGHHYNIPDAYGLGCNITVYNSRHGVLVADFREVFASYDLYQHNVKTVLRTRGKFPLDKLTDRILARLEIAKQYINTNMEDY